MKNNISNDNKRYISVIVMLILIVPAIILTNKAGTIGHIIGFGFYTLLGIYALWEVVNNFKLSLHTKIFISLIPVVMMMWPWTKLFTYSESNVNIVDFVKQGYGYMPLVISVSLFLVVLFDPMFYKDDYNITFKFLILFLSVVLTTTMTKTLWVMNLSNWYWPFVFVSIASMADTGGYFGGKYLGKYIFNGKKLAPNISPKKTWAGFLIGYSLTFSLVIPLLHFTDAFPGLDPTLHWSLIILSATIFPIVVVLGDLFFSAVKRVIGIKDFSNLIPGHGGIFDRVDSLSALMLIITIIYLVI